MNEHVVEYGRMFNRAGRRNGAQRLRDRHRILATSFGDRRRKPARKSIPVGEIIYINGLPFTIIGMFQHYESEQDRKARELAKASAKPANKTGRA